MRLLAEPPTAKEYLLYNFSLQVNDTMFISNPGSPFPQYAGDFIVDSIIVKPILNSNRKFFYLHAVDTTVSNSKNTIWVEGIGSLCLINTPGAAPKINGAGQLSCYFHNDVQEYENLDSIASCSPIRPVGIRENNLENDLQITQTSDGSSVIVNQRSGIEKLSLSLLSIEGKSLLNIKTSKNSIEIPLDQFKPGMYLLRIEGEIPRQKSSKIIRP